MFLSNLKSFINAHRSEGRGEAFGFDDITTEVYLKWAFCHDHLFVSTVGNKVTGVGIAYPIKASNGDHESLFTFNNKIPRDEEHKYDLCIMDMISVDSESTKNLVKEFKLRYPHWNNCKKWSLRFGNLTEITNKYINLL